MIEITAFRSFYKDINWHQNILFWLQWLYEWLLVSSLYDDIHTLFIKAFLFELLCICRFQTVIRIKWRLIFANVVRCFRLWLWVDYFICFKFTFVFFYWMFVSSIQGINRSISKGMSNICLKVIIEENWRSQNFNFLSLKYLSPSQFLASSNSSRYHWILKLLVAT